MKLLWIVVLLGIVSLFVDGETQLEKKEAHAFLKFYKRVKRDDGNIYTHTQHAYFKNGKNYRFISKWVDDYERLMDIDWSPVQ